MKVTFLLSLLIMVIFLKTPANSNDCPTLLTNKSSYQDLNKILSCIHKKINELKVLRSSSRSEKDIKNLVRGYLITNPEVLMEVQLSFENKKKIENKNKNLIAIKNNAKLLFYPNLSPIGGNKYGDVKLIEFFDYNCPYCRESRKQVEKFVVTDGSIKRIYKEFPIFGGASKLASRAALASKKQGKYTIFHKALMHGKKRLTKKIIFNIAKSIGLNVRKLKRDMKSNDITKELSEVATLANKLGIQGTPAYMVGNNLIPGAPKNLLERMQKQAKKLRKNPCPYC